MEAIESDIKGFKIVLILVYGKCVYSCIEDIKRL